MWKFLFVFSKYALTKYQQHIGMIEKATKNMASVNNKHQTTVDEKNQLSEIVHCPNILLQAVSINPPL